MVFLGRIMCGVVRLFQGFNLVNAQVLAVSRVLAASVNEIFLPVGINKKGLFAGV